MTRYSTVLRIRPLPWPIWFVRRLRCGPIDRMDGSTSAPRIHLWFAFLVPYRWRSVHRWWARRSGLFWLPCVLCTRESGGHEWRDIDGKPSSVPDPTDPRLHVGICPECTRAGRGWRRD